jgi:glycosyltransferase involved in cell wall biosynthesis
MKSIVFLSHSASLTGAPLLLCDLAASLDSSKYRMSFLLGEDGPLVDRFQQLGPTVVEPLYPNEMKYWREVKRIASRITVLRKIQPDLVYCNTIHPAKWLGYSRVLGVPTITHVHELSMGFNSLSSAEHWMLRRFSGHFIAVSDAVKTYLVQRQNVPARKVDVVRAGIRTERFGTSIDVKSLKDRLGLNGAMVVGTVGRITYMKGSDLFLRIASNLKEIIGTDVKLKFLVIGTTEDRRFYASFNSMLQQSEIRDDFVVLENVKDVRDHYQLMDVFVSTAREDPFPLVIMEAMASRTPVVAFAVGGIPEAINKECGILIEALDMAAMAQSVARLINDRVTRERMGRAGRDRVERDFNIVGNVKKIEEVIDSMVEKRIG